MTIVNAIIAVMLLFSGVTATAALATMVATPAEAEDVASAVAEPGREQSRRRIEVAFVLDTTGSMAELIDGAKARIVAIADEIRRSHPQSDLRFALVGYRDIGDAYVTDVMDLTGDIQAVYARPLRYRAEGGGDWPESVNEALNTAVERLGWTKGEQATRLVFLVGDAPPHMDYQQDVPFLDTLKIAGERGIVVNAVQAGNATDTELAWRTIASAGHGEYIAIPQTGGVVVIETPYDQRIYDLQIRLNGTVVPYGSQAEQQAVEETLRTIEAAPAATASDMASYSTRAPAPMGAQPVVIGGGDLVADIVEGRIDPAAVAEEDLPEAWRALSPEERSQRLEAEVAERRRLQEELAGLVAERDSALAEASAAAGTGEDDAFDAAVSGVLGRQL